LLIEMLETLHGDILRLSFQTQCDHRLSSDYIGTWIEVKLYNDIWIPSWDFIGAYFERWLGVPHFFLQHSPRIWCWKHRWLPGAWTDMWAMPFAEWCLGQVLTRFTRCFYGLDLRFFPFFGSKSGDLDIGNHR
jgi:hypothetical protein